MPANQGEVHIQSVMGLVGNVVGSDMGLSAVALSGLFSDLVGTPTIPSAGTNSATGTLTRAAATASGTQVVTIGFQPSFVIFYGSDDSDANTYSNGWDDGTIAVCAAAQAVTITALLASLLSMKFTGSTSVVNLLANGHTGIISAKSSTGFTYSWTKVGSGRAVTVKYLAVK